MVVVVAPSDTAGLANYFTYINGALYNSLVNTYYPPAVPRENAWLGRSGWGDPYMVLELDTFSIYDAQLSPQQVSTLFTRAFPHGADTAPSAGGAADEFYLPGGVRCTGYGTANQMPTFFCATYNCGQYDGTIVASPIKAPAGAHVHVTHLGLFQIKNATGQGEFEDNSGLWNFTLGLYYLNSSSSQLQLLVQTVEVTVTDPGISTPYVIAGLQQPYTVPDWALDNLWLANWFTGGSGYLELLTLYDHPANFVITESGSYSSDGLPQTIPANFYDTAINAQDILSCDTTASLIVA